MDCSSLCEHSSARTCCHAHPLPHRDNSVQYYEDCLDELEQLSIMKIVLMNLSSLYPVWVPGLLALLGGGTKQEDAKFFSTSDCSDETFHFLFRGFCLDLLW